jgi:hypothetical protein
MERSAVRIGGTYSLIIAGRATQVRITEEKRKGEKLTGYGTSSVRLPSTPSARTSAPLASSLAPTPLRTPPSTTVLSPRSAKWP